MGGLELYSISDQIGRSLIGGIRIGGLVPLCLVFLLAGCDKLQDSGLPFVPSESNEEHLARLRERGALLLWISSLPESGLSAAEADFHARINQHRIFTGCAPLGVHSGMLAVARAHSQDMHDRSFFSHTNPDGKSPFDRLTNASIGYSSAGENIAVGYRSAEAVFTGWYNSSGHWANMENCNYTHHGIGYVESGNYWTDLFAKDPH